MTQTLYRKWRSQTFSDLVGQEAIVRTLRNALSGGSLAHAYLFAGPRGTGKTSTARLLAKTINCQHPQNGEPCNECQQCREITAGSSFNVIEIDAASNRGIESIRDLRDRVVVAPATGKYKVYILDEVHMLTTEACNALLKTLEEPPGHAIFVMATTDVHKILPTILSRCQRFDFKRISTREIVERLHYVAEKECVTLDRDAAGLIARAAGGGMRDALSLLDQAIAYSGQEIKLSQVQAMLGVADPHAIQKFITFIARMERPAGLHLIHDLADAGADLRQMNNQIADYMRAMMLARAGATVSAIVDGTEDEVREILQAAQLFRLEELTEFARVFAQNDLVQKNIGTPQLGLELALLTCIALHGKAMAGIPVTSEAPSALPQPLSIQEQSSAPTSTVQEKTIQLSSLHPSSSQQLSAAPAAASSAFPLEQTSFPTYAPLGMQEDSLQMEEARIKGSAVERPTTATAGSVSLSGSALTLQQIQSRWESVKRRVKTMPEGAMVAALLNDYTLVTVEDSAGTPIIIIKANADFHYKAIIKSEARREVIEWALTNELGQTCSVRLLPPEHSGPSIPSPPPQPSARYLHAIPSTQQAGTNDTSLLLSRSWLIPESAPNIVTDLEAQEGDQIPQPIEEHIPAASLDAGFNNRRVDEGASEPPQAEPVLADEERLKQQAANNPVVQEVIRLFQAQIKEVQVK
jgi:DNA polymerase-3 subunit gamma/tau